MTAHSRSLTAAQRLTRGSRGARSSLSVSQSCRAGPGGRCGRPRGAAALAAGGRGRVLRAAPQKMSAAWCWWLPALLWGVAGGYVVLSSVSWPLPEAGGAADELHSSSTEEALPGLLEEAGGLWKQSFPASAYREDAALGPGAVARRSEQGAAPSRMFSYRRQPAAPPGRAATARRLARHGAWGFVASRAAHGKVPRVGGGGSARGGSAFNVFPLVFPGTQTH